MKRFLSLLLCALLLMTSSALAEIRFQSFLCFFIPSSFLLLLIYYDTAFSLFRLYKVSLDKLLKPVSGDHKTR